MILRTQMARREKLHICWPTKLAMNDAFELSIDFRKRWPTPPDFDQLMALEGDVFRQVARRRTLKFYLGGKSYFIKIHQGVGWPEIFKNLLQLRWPVLGARNEYRAILRLQQLGVETMTLAGYGNRGWNPAEMDSFVVTESLEHTISLEDLTRDWPANPPQTALKRALIQRVAEMARQLHTHGVNHRDLYICHFLLQLNEHDQLDLESGLHLYLIDLHRVQIRNRTPERWVVKDVAALHFSSMGCGLSQRDRFRFMRIYAGRHLRDTLRQDESFWNKVERRAQALWAKPIKG